MYQADGAGVPFLPEALGLPKMGNRRFVRRRLARWELLLLGCHGDEMCCASRRGRVGGYDETSTFFFFFVTAAGKPPPPGTSLQWNVPKVKVTVCERELKKKKVCVYVCV